MAIASLNEGNSFLEIGCGKASNLIGVDTKFDLVVGTDIQPLTVMRELKGLGNYELIVTDKASCFKDGVFDVVAFNPPYLPSEQIVDRAVDGGRLGLEVALSFLDDALRVSKTGQSKIIVILSSESDIVAFEKYCKENDLKLEILLEESLFFERLFAFMIEKIRNDVG